MNPSDLVDFLIVLIESGDWDDTAVLEWALAIAEELLNEHYHA